MAQSTILTGATGSASPPVAASKPTVTKMMATMVPTKPAMG